MDYVDIAPLGEIFGAMAIGIAPGLVFAAALLISSYIRKKPDLTFSGMIAVIGIMVVMSVGGFIGYQTVKDRNAGEVAQQLNGIYGLELTGDQINELDYPGSGRQGKSGAEPTPDEPQAYGSIVNPGDSDGFITLVWNGDQLILTDGGDELERAR